MTSRKPTQPETANATTAADEINRFVRYLGFRTRDLRETFATFLGTNHASSTVALREEDDEDLFVDVGPTEEGWVDVADEAIEVPEVRPSSTTWAPTTSLTVDSRDASQQRYRPAPPPPPGPIQQTSVATQRAALQALGLTGLYLKFGLRLVAGDVGWLTHTTTFEDAVQKSAAAVSYADEIGQELWERGEEGGWEEAF
jgi:hypothetical protein